MGESKPHRMMKLGAFVHESGQHVVARRHPDVRMHAGTSVAEAIDFARTAEHGEFDLLLPADGGALDLGGNADARGRMGKAVKVEPITLLSAPAA